MSRPIVLAVALAALAVSAAAARGTPPRLIAYEAPDGIHLVAADGSGDRRIPGTLRGDQNPAWSPDGTRLAVVAAPGSTLGVITVIDVRTGRRDALAVASRAELPAWSHDGSTIVFDSDRDGDWRLYSVRPDGTDLTRLLGGRFAYDAEVAADGTLAFVSDGPTRDAALFVARNGDAPREVRTLGDAWAPSWSPDGSVLTFTSDGDWPGGKDKTWAAEVERIKADGTGEQRLTRNRSWDGDGRTSPDGSQVAFDTGRYGWDEVMVMNPDGTGQRRLTRELHGDACCPAWQPTP